LAERAISLRVPYITIRIRILGGGPEIETDALVDTGYDGHLILPVIRLPDEVEPFTQRWLQSADGHLSRLPIYRGEVEIVGLPAILPCSTVIGGSEVLLGRKILDSFRVTFDHGREIVVEA